MPTLVPQVPQPQALDAHLVSAPVSAAAVGQVWAGQLAFLLGRALPSIASLCPHTITGTTTSVAIPVQWWPSPGCRLALLTVDVYGENYVNVAGRVFGVRKRCTLDVTAPAGGARYAGPYLLDGSETLQQRDVTVAGRMSYSTLLGIDTPGDVADTVDDVMVEIQSVGGDNHGGIAGITLVEIPVATLQPEANGEPGLLSPAIDPRNDLHDGDSGIGSGITELVAAEQDARLRQRWHWQIATYEDTTYAWTRSSATIGQIDWVGSVGTSVTPVFRVRIPKTYGTNASARIRVRYRTNGTAGTLRVTRTVVGLGASSTFDLSLPDSGGAWASEYDALTLRTDGTDQELELQFSASTGDGSAIHISSIALIQDEAL